MPAHSSSPKTRLFSSARFRILLSSAISTAKDDSPLNILSLLLIRVKIFRNGLYTNFLQATKCPLWAKIIFIPSAFISELFPDALVPNNNIPLELFRLLLFLNPSGSMPCSFKNPKNPGSSISRPIDISLLT